MDTEVTIEQVQLRNAVQAAVQQELRRVLRELLDDGVEFEPVRNCVLVWSMKTRGIGFTRDRVWHVMRTNGGQAGMTIRGADGDGLIFRSFHELLQWLFEQPEVSQQDESTLSDDDFQIKHRAPHRWKDEQERREWFAKHGRELRP